MMKNKNAKLLALKQALAFSIDLGLVSLPLLIAPSLEILPFFTLLWYLYIPLCEYYFSQTLGMRVVGTRILSTKDMQSHIELGTAFRRQIARIGFIWGVFGWLFLFFEKQYIADYVIVDEKYSSIEPHEDGGIEVHKSNEYKVIFFVLLSMFLFIFLQGIIL